VKKPVAIMAVVSFLMVPCAAWTQNAAYQKGGSFNLPDKNSPGTIQEPAGIAVTPDGSIFILDRRGKIGVFSKTGDPENFLTLPQITRPALVAVTPSGDLVVLDGKENTLHVISKEGEVLASFAGGGNGAGELSRPVALAVGQNKFIYVLDADRKGIAIFSGDGLFIRQLVMPSILQKPTAMTVDPEGSIYVADETLPGAFYKLPPFDQIPWSAEVPIKLAARVPLKGEVSPDLIAMAASPAGAVTILDHKMCKLWMRQPDGSAEQNGNNCVYGGVGDTFGSFMEPTAMAFATADEMVILDGKIRKVERIKLPAIGEQKTRTGPPPRIHAGYCGPRSQPGTLVAIDCDSTGLIGFYFDRGGKAVVEQKAEKSLLRTIDGDTIVSYSPVLQSDEATYSQDFTAIGGIAIWDSLVAVSDPANDRVSVFRKGTASPIASFGDRWKDKRHFKKPMGLAFDAKGRVVVADYGTNSVRIVSEEWATVATDIGFAKPIGVATDRSGAIYMWGEGGTGLSRIPVSGGLETLGGAVFPASVGGLAFDPYGNAFVLDMATRQILVLDLVHKTPILSFGPAERYLEPSGLFAGPSGDVYLADRKANVTYSFRWSVDVPPVDELGVTYHEGGITVRWPASDDKYLWGYDISGRDLAGHPFPLARVRSNEYQWRLPDSGDGVIWEVSVAPISISGKVGGMSPPAALHGLRALDELRRHGYAAAAPFAKDAQQQIEATPSSAPRRVEFHADSSVVIAFRLSRFFAACEKKNQDGILELGPPLRSSVPPEHRVAYHRAMAATYMEIKKRDEAAQELRSLGAASLARGTPVLNDSSFVELIWKTFESSMASRDTTGAIAFLDNVRASFPDSALQEAGLEERLCATKARVKFAPAITLWRSAKFKEAAQYSEGILTTGTVEIVPQERILLLQLLAVNLYEDKNKEDAKSRFLRIYEVKPDFQLEVEAARMSKFYGFNLYTPEMLAYFGALPHP
jgi:DNA-binding beta-propeller fold protein YncE